MGNSERILGAFVEALGSACPGIPIYTNGGVTLGRDDFETEDEWQAFLRPFGLSGLGTGYRIHVRPAGDETILDTDTASVEIAWDRGFPSVTDL